MLLKALASNTTCFILCICALNHSSTFGFPEVPPLFRNLTIEYLVFFPVTVSWENFEPQTSFFLEFGVCQLLSRTSRGIYRELGYFLARVSTASWTFRFQHFDRKERKDPLEPDICPPPPNPTHVHIHIQKEDDKYKRQLTCPKVSLLNQNQVGDSKNRISTLKDTLNAPPFLPSDNIIKTELQEQGKRKGREREVEGKGTELKRREEKAVIGKEKGGREISPCLVWWRCGFI